MGFVRLGLMVLLLSGCFVAVAHAQFDDSTEVDDAQLPPADYGAGYKMIMVHQHQEHAPGPGADPFGEGQITLDLLFPVIADPRTAEAKNYNTAIRQIIHQWWKTIGGPKDNSQSADPGTGYNLNCVPVGEPEAYGQPPADQMLPGVISMSCVAAADLLASGTANGGLAWGYNWLLAQHRPIQPDDIFAPNSGWLKALTLLLDADRKRFGLAPWATKLDAADRHHWFLGSAGLGFAYSNSEFSGYASPCEGCFDVIPWSKLAPYLRKGGVVPQADWSAALPLPYK